MHYKNESPVEKKSPRIRLEDYFPRDRFEITVVNPKLVLPVARR